MRKYIAVHGHFYQPPREDPWTGEIPPELSAAPFHDWNQKITAECYLPNTEAKILDHQGRIGKTLNNFSRISFDVGPTLLAWLEREQPKVYEKIISADRESRDAFSGHGNALAQAYNHIILPLANRRDKETQVQWALKDFRHRFGRESEGLWLPETAVDLESLEVMAKRGVRFTLLAPHQARRWRYQGEAEWTQASTRPLDPLVPYRQALPGGKSILIFFYHGPLSRGIAFEHFLQDGESLKNQILAAFPRATTWPHCLSVATDGETYGHHFRFGEMALAYLLNSLTRDSTAALTNFGEHLARYPVQHEVEILENTSWSCPHGVERWRSDCGCHLQYRPGWNQAWRRPLREAMDWLRDATVSAFEREAGRYVADPWEARNDAVDLWLGPPEETVRHREFFKRHGNRKMDSEGQKRLVQLMELQRHLMCMYTSCGWFFDDPAGLETALILRHAAKALEMAGALLGLDLKEPYLERLRKVKSNYPGPLEGPEIFFRACQKEPKEPPWD